MRLGRYILAILSALALLPLFVIFVAAAFAALLKCEVSDIGPSQCLVFGTDIGWLFSGAMTIGWLSLITIPLLMGIVTVWMMIELYVSRRKRRKARRAERQAAA